MKSGKFEAIPLALLIDRVVGEPPTRYHPVAWMGTAIAAAEAYAPRNDRRRAFLHGILISVGGAGLVFGLGRVLVNIIDRLPRPLALLSEAGILKTNLSVRNLASAGSEVQTALEANKLREARRLAAWHLVSRDTSGLDKFQVAAAAIESVAENTSDSIVAPLFFYAFGGLPATLAYRFLNTADAMLGYRDSRHEWLGKAPARLDDAANWLPARITALLLVWAACLIGQDGRNAWRVWKRDACKTASPNAGHPMSATAGALGVTLEKVGHYRLGEGQRRPASKDIGRSVSLMYATSILAALLFTVIAALRSADRNAE